MEQRSKTLEKPDMKSGGFGVQGTMQPDRLWKLSLYSLFIYVCVWGGCTTQATACEWKSEHSLQEWVLFS